MVTEVAVAIVNYNTRDLLDACLASVKADGAAEVVVVDNGSTDGSQEMVQTRYPWVTLIVNPSNRGYGAAANQAVAACSADDILLLNSDTRLQPGALQALSELLDHHPRAAIIGPRLLNEDGSVQISCYHFPTPMHVWLLESGFYRVLSPLSWFRNRYLPAWSHDDTRAVPWILGAALVLRRRVFETLGGFNPAFFMYYEEVDLCYRVWSAGWEVHFAPAAEVVHVGSASTDQYREEMNVQLYRSLFFFYEQHYSWWQRQQLRIVMIYVMLRNIVRDSVRMFRQRDHRRHPYLAEDLQAWWRILKSG